eukprot:m.227858 g.227858  ORF g.227858 m.227858 type:complete len:212 (-) comp17330_c0_seq2:9-644(-)
MDFRHALCATAWVLVIGATKASPEPPTWPARLHISMVTNRGGNLTFDDLFYDYTLKKNFILIKHQQPIPDTYDLETDTGNTYYYNPESQTCKVIQMGVGPLRPDWLKGARFQGQRTIHNIVCNCWNQTWDTDPSHDLTYCAELNTNRPVQWTFGIDGAVQDVLVYEANAGPKDRSVWEIPSYCNSTEVESRRGSDQHNRSRVTTQSVFAMH